ncbi:MAG: hypothetical protein LUQ09_00905 [Methanomassiliicoccales archaeon]|nr:hypothetical protein [Methanomassiliicoccales archaeon]
MSMTKITIDPDDQNVTYYGAKVRMSTEDREAMLYAVAMAPGLLYHITISYLRMRRRANKQGKEFYRALVRDGVPKDQARSLADEYSSAISLVKMIKEMRHFTS